MTTYKIVFDDNFKTPYFDSREFKNLINLKKAWEKDRGIPKRKFIEYWPFAYFLLTVNLIAVFYNIIWYSLGMQVPETYIPFFLIYSCTVIWWTIYGNGRLSEKKRIEMQREQYYRLIMVGVSIDSQSFEKTKQSITWFNKNFELYRRNLPNELFI